MTGGSGNVSINTYKTGKEAGIRNRGKLAGV